MKFDEKLQKLRKASGLSQEMLADKLNISRQAVSKWESGASYPEMDKLIQMSKIFNCSLDELVNDTETDKTIFKNKAQKRNMYFDSFFEFITKSINMFSNMKFGNLVKSLIELAVMAAILCFGAFIIYSFGEMFLDEIIFSFYTDNQIVWNILSFIDNILSAVFLFIVIAITLIIYIQIYKIRYLDYFDKLMYEYEQKNVLKLDMVDEKNEEIKDESKYKKDNLKEKKENIAFEEKNKDRIIIRDPEHRPFAFLSIISKWCVSIFKMFVALFSLVFVISLIFFVIWLVLSIYMFTLNDIFFGVILGLVGLIVFDVLVLDLLFKFIINSKVRIKLAFLVSIGAIIVSSIGAGIVLIECKDFKFLEFGNKYEFKKVVEVVPNDAKIDLTEDILYGNYVIVIDETKKDIEYIFNYNETIHKYDFKAVDEVYSLNLTARIDEIDEAIKVTIEGLKNNELRLYDLYDYPFVEIRANKENVLNMVKYLRDEQNIIFVDNNGDGIYGIY